MSLGLIRIEKFLRIDRNETVWFGYKFGNDLENFGLVWNEFQYETFTKVILLSSTYLWNIIKFK